MAKEINSFKMFEYNQTNQTGVQLLRFVQKVSFHNSFVTLKAALPHYSLGIARQAGGSAWEWQQNKSGTAAAEICFGQNKYKELRVINGPCYKLVCWRVCCALIY